MIDSDLNAMLVLPEVYATTDQSAPKFGKALSGCTHGVLVLELRSYDPHSSVTISATPNGTVYQVVTEERRRRRSQQEREERTSSENDLAGICGSYSPPPTLVLLEAR